MYVRLVMDFFFMFSDFPAQILGLKLVLPAQTWTLGDHRNYYFNHPWGLVESLQTVLLSFLEMLWHVMK